MSSPAPPSYARLDRPRIDTEKRCALSLTSMRTKKVRRYISEEQLLGGVPISVYDAHAMPVAHC